MRKKYYKTGCFFENCGLTIWFSDSESKCSNNYSFFKGTYHLPQTFNFLIPISLQPDELNL